ncbi:MAG: restriction endonuclease subunit S [Pseudomonadota bacterium]
MKYQVYLAYKESGVEWLGEVPEHWEIKRLRFVIKLNPSKAELKKEELNLETSFLPMEKVGTKGDIKLSETRLAYTVINGYTYFREQDVIIAKITPCFENGKGAVCNGLKNGIGFGTTEFHVIRPHKNMRPNFIFYLTHSHHFINFGESEMRGAAGQKRVTDDYIKDYKLGIPTLEEQQQIATFLDKETTQIDTLIEKQQKLIELLKEKRQALISHAVTKGLNPNVPLKESGVEWLGKVPEHWETARLKYLSKKIIDGTHFTPTYLPSGVPFLRVTDIQNKEIDLTKVKYISEDEHNELTKRCQPQKGDLLLSKNGTIGIPKVVDLDWKFSLFVSISLIKLKKELNVTFAEYFFQSQPIKEQTFGLTKQSTVTNLHLDKIQNYYFVVPPIEEQHPH